MKIVGQLVCGPGEADRWLSQTLNDFARICDDVLVATCNADQYTKQMISAYDFRQYEDNREWGRFQPDIKTDLLKRIHQMQPDWVLVLDADETVPTLNRAEFERLAKGRSAMQLYVTNLWNDAGHYHKGLSFWNVRAYRPFADKTSRFRKQPVHCGNAPMYFYSLPARESYVPHILLHRGLMLPEDRMRKVRRYEEYDPKAIHKGREYYDALATMVGGSIYDEQVVIDQLTNYVRKL